MYELPFLSVSECVCLLFYPLNLFQNFPHAPGVSIQATASIVCTHPHTHTNPNTTHFFFFFFERKPEGVSRRKTSSASLSVALSASLTLHSFSLFPSLTLAWSDLQWLSSQFLLVSALFCSCTLQQTILHLSQQVKCLNCLHVSTQGGSGSSTSTAADSNGRPQDLQMSENLIYYSREEGKDTKTVYSYDLKRRTQHRRSSGFRRI